MIIAFVLGFVVVLNFVPAPLAKNLGRIKVKDTTYIVELAKTDTERSQGLQFRKTLADQNGMLFVFDKPGLYDFWNKNTYLELDLIYIKDSKIVERGFLPIFNKNQTPVIYSPQSQADYVLEIKKGEIARYQFAVGDPVSIVP